MDNLEAACRAFSANKARPSQYSILFDTIAKERGIDRNHQMLELSQRDLENWVDNKISEYDNADSRIPN